MAVLSPSRQLWTPGARPRSRVREYARWRRTLPAVNYGLQRGASGKVMRSGTSGKVLTTRNTSTCCCQTSNIPGDCGGNCTEGTMPAQFTASFFGVALTPYNTCCPKISGVSFIGATKANTQYFTGTIVLPYIRTWTTPAPVFCEWGGFYDATDFVDVDAWNNGTGGCSGGYGGKYNLLSVGLLIQRNNLGDATRYWQLNVTLSSQSPSVTPIDLILFASTTASESRPDRCDPTTKTFNNSLSFSGCHPNNLGSGGYATVTPG